MEIPAGYADLFGDDSRALLVLATTRPDGAPVEFHDISTSSYRSDLAQRYLDRSGRLLTGSSN